MSDQLGQSRLTPALMSVIQERARQDLNWGEQNHCPDHYLVILGEEFGETCKAALKARDAVGFDKIAALADLRAEAVQTAAVALALVECLDRQKWKWSERPADGPHE